MSHRPKDLSEIRDVPPSYPVRDQFSICDHCGERYSRRYALKHSSGKCLKMTGKLILLLDCPKCEKPGVPEGKDFCLKCGWDGEK